MMQFANKDVKTSVIFMFQTLKDIKGKINIMKREMEDVKRTKWNF